MQLLGKVSERGGRCEGEATPLGGGKIWKVWCRRGGGDGLTEEWGMRSPGSFKGREGRMVRGLLYLRPPSLAAGN